ncbi:MAG: hypothetical protein R3F39_20895 [Myxococcota bacterium]
MTSLFRAISVSLSLLLSAALAAACADAAPSGGGLVLSTASLAPCVPNENGDFRFPSNADRVVVRATGGHIPGDAPIVGIFASDDAASQEQAVLEDVPAGEGVVIEVVACKGATPTWGGITRGLEVLAGNRNTADVFLTPVDAAACVGGKGVLEGDRQMKAGHAFAATAFDGDFAYALGGFDAYDLAKKELRATTSVDRYSRNQSRFAALARLQERRAMGAAQIISNDGTIRIIGGVRAVTLNTGGDRPPIFPSQDSAPSSGIEVYDPATGNPVAGPDSTLPALPALGSAPDGTVVAVGGVDGTAGGTPTYATGVTVFGATGSIKSFGLPAGRYGATVLPTDDGHALVYGGTASGDPAGAAAWLDLGASSATQLTGTVVGGVPFMAGGLFIGDDAAGWHFLVLGGSDIMGGAGATQFTAGATTPRAILVTVAPSGAAVTTRDLLDGSPLAGDLFRRVAPLVVDLGELGIMLGGGLTSLTSDPACPGAGVKDCLPQKLARLALASPTGALSVTGTPAESPVAALGAGLLALGDGSWLLSGGIETLAAETRAIDLHAGLLRFGVDDPGMCQLTAP